MADANKFKVGDWIYSLRKYCGHEKGDVVQVLFCDFDRNTLKLITSKTEYNLVDKTGWAYVEDFRLALPHEIPNYKPHYEIYY